MVGWEFLFENYGFVGIRLLASGDSAEPSYHKIAEIQSGVGGHEVKKLKVVV